MAETDSREFILLADAFRRTLTEEDQKKGWKTRYYRGDRLTNLYPEEVNRLLELGAIVDAAESENTDAEAAQEDAEQRASAQESLDAQVDAEATEAGTGTMPSGAVPEASGDGGTAVAGAGEPGEDATEEDWRNYYESWLYADLQREAKSLTGDGSGAKVDLVERLVAYRVSNA